VLAFRAGSCLIRQHYIRLLRFGRDKHSSLVGSFVSHEKCFVILVQDYWGKMADWIITESEQGFQLVSVAYGESLYADADQVSVL
jgi:hypothetical protein